MCRRTWFVVLILALVVPSSWSADGDVEGEGRQRERRDGDREVRRDGDRGPAEREVRDRRRREEGERQIRGDRDREGGEREVPHAGDREENRREVPHAGDHERDERETRERRRREEGERRERRGPPAAVMLERAFRGLDLPEEEQRAAMTMVREHLQPRLAELAELCRTNPEQARREADNIVNEALDLIEMKQRNPKLFARKTAFLMLERRSLELARAANVAKGEAKTKLKNSLKAVLEKAFAAKQEMMKLEVQGMEADLGQLKELIRKREARKQSIIQRRLRQLVDDRDEELNW